MLALVVLGISGATITLYLLIWGLDRVPSQAVRFMLTGILLVFVYRGHLWARTLTVLLTGLASLGAAVAALTIASEQPANAMVMGIFSVAYGTTAAVLLFSTSVSTFLNSQNKRTSRRGIALGTVRHCTTCGRQNSIQTRICPRCETRFDESANMA
jgi:hypothetical protein